MDPMMTQEEHQLRRVIDRVERLLRRLRVNGPMARRKLVRTNSQVPGPAAEQLLSPVASEILDPGVLLLMALIALDTLVDVVTPPSVTTFKTEFANATLAGDTELIERVEGKKLGVRGYVLNNGGGSVATVRFRSGTRAICSDKDLAADGGGAVTAGLVRGYWFETSVGEALNINLDAAGTIGVDVVYDEVSP